MPSPIATIALAVSLTGAAVGGIVCKCFWNQERNEQEHQQEQIHEIEHNLEDVIQDILENHMEQRDSEESETSITINVHTHHSPPVSRRSSPMHKGSMQEIPLSPPNSPCELLPCITEFDIDFDIDID